MLKSLKAELHEVAASVASLQVERGGLHPAMSPAHVGLITLSALQAMRLGIEDFAATAGPPVLDTAQAADAQACSTEAELVRFITPVLWSLRGLGSLADYAGDTRLPCPLLLANSESHPWLDDFTRPFPSPKLLCKPDLFMTYWPFFQPRLRTDAVAGDFRYCYGVLADRSLQLAGGVRELYAAKLKLTNTAFGELVVWHQLLQDGPCRGMLFGSSGFWLYKSVNGLPVQLIKSSWTTPGSQGLVQTFFELDAGSPPKLVQLLDFTLRTLGVRCVSSCDAFLGCGSTAVVMAVQPVPVVGSDDGARASAASSSDVPVAAAASFAPLALKVVVGTPPGRLHDEFTTLAAAAKAGAPVIAPVPQSFVIMDGIGAGFLLAEVGRPITSGKLSLHRRLIPLVFSALLALHRTGFCHGDATLMNLLTLTGNGCSVTESSLRWIDFGAGYVPNTNVNNFRLLVKDDAETLAASVLACHLSDLPPGVAAAAAAYAAAASSEQSMTVRSGGLRDGVGHDRSPGAAELDVLVDVVDTAASAIRRL